MIREFYSNGKLLLSGEYAVLDGAYAWAVPTKFGQSLKVSKMDSHQLHWISFDEKGNVWFEVLYTLDPLSEVSSSDSKIAEVLIKILQQAQNLNPVFLVGPHGYKVETKLDFPRDWGLGTSSTLINNMAHWANIDPYNLLSKTFGGSGYDIACAKHNLPILFHINNRRPHVQELTKSIPFKSALYFVFLNQKKNSREAIAHYNDLHTDRKEFVAQINTLSRAMADAQNVQDFELLIEKHEKEVSKVLGLEPVKDRLFPDYWGAIKSLGAWGGDFVMVTGNEKTPQYFKEKGYETIIPYSQMVLS